MQVLELAVVTADYTDSINQGMIFLLYTILWREFIGK